MKRIGAQAAWLTLSIAAGPAISSASCDLSDAGAVKDVTRAGVFLDGGSIQVEGVTQAGKPVSFFLDQSLDRIVPGLVVEEDKVRVDPDAVQKSLGCLRAWAERYTVEFGMPETPSSETDLLEHEKYWLVQQLLSVGVPDAARPFGGPAHDP